MFSLDTRVVPTQFAVERLRNLTALHVPLYDSAFFDRPSAMLKTGPDFHRFLKKALEDDTAWVRPHAPVLLDTLR